MRHSSLNTLCHDIAFLTIFAEFMKICAEERLYPHYMDWKHQNYCVKNKLIEHRNAAMQLNIADIECAEIALARYIQRFVFGKVHMKLSLDVQMYVKAVSQIKNTQLKCKMNQLPNLKPFLDSNGILHVHGCLSKTKMNFKQKHQIILPRRLVLLPSHVECTLRTGYLVTSTP